MFQLTIENTQKGQFILQNGGNGDVHKAENMYSRVKNLASFARLSSKWTGLHNFPC